MMAEPEHAGDEEAQREVRHAPGQQLELAPEDDVLGAASAVDERHVGPRLAVAQPTQHRHHRRHPRPTRQEGGPPEAVAVQGELPAWAIRPKVVARPQSVEHPPGANASRLNFHRHSNGEGPRWRGRQGVGTQERLRCCRQLQRDELSGRVSKPGWRVRNKGEGPHARCFLHGVDQLQNMSPVVPLRPLVERQKTAGDLGRHGGHSAGQATLRSVRTSRRVSRVSMVELYQSTNWTTPSSSCSLYGPGS